MSKENKAMNRAIAKAKQDAPKKVNAFCDCGKQLTEINVFFGKKKCHDCEPLHLLHQQKNNWQAQDIVTDLPF